MVNDRAVILESIEIYEMIRNKRKKGFVYEARCDDTGEVYAEFHAPEDMDEEISLRVVAPHVPMHPGGLRNNYAKEG